MFTLDTRLLTYDGFKEAWELFPGHTLIDETNTPHTIRQTIERERPVSVVTLDDFTTFTLSDDAIEEYELQEGDEMLLKEPVRFYSVEDSQGPLKLVERREGLDFGTYAKYKFIPHRYLVDHRENRKRFLEGLLFSHSMEAHTDDGRVYFLVAYPEFAEDLVYLTRSLGGNGDVHPFYLGGHYYEVTLWLPPLFGEEVPSRRVLKIEPKGTEPIIRFVSDQTSYILNTFILLSKERDTHHTTHLD